MTKLGDNIRKFRSRAKLSQERLAQRAKVAHMTISRLERGLQRPRVDVLQRIARVLQVRLDDLVGRE